MEGEGEARLASLVVDFEIEGQPLVKYISPPLFPHDHIICYQSEILTVLDCLIVPVSFNLIQIYLFGIYFDSLDI